MEEIQGCTIERRQHSKITTEPRQLTNGGMVIAVGNRDMEHCYLDYLMNERLLGNEEDSRIRYDTGYDFRELYFSWNVSAKTSTGMPSSGPRMFTSESDIENDTDLAEKKYHAVMRSLPKKYRVAVRVVCIEDFPHEKPSEKARELIIDSLDALWAAMERYR